MLLRVTTSFVARPSLDTMANQWGIELQLPDSVTSDPLVGRHSSVTPIRR